jgi:hypothetical protein
VGPIPCTSVRRDHVWFGTRATVLTKGYSFRNSSGGLAIFAAIRRASSRVNNFPADTNHSEQHVCISDNG